MKGKIVSIVALPLIAGLIMYHFYGIGLAKLTLFIVFSLALLTSQLIDASYIGLLIVVLSPALGITSMSDFSKVFAHQILWLIVGALALSNAVGDSHLAEILATKILKNTKSVFSLIYSMVFISIVMSIFIPNAVARAQLLRPIIERTPVRSLQRKRIMKTMFMGLSFTTMLTGTFTLTSSTASIYASTMIDQLTQFNLSYANWLVLFGPLAVGSSFLLQYVIVREFGVTNESIVVRTQEVKFTSDQIKMLVILIVTILGWVICGTLGLSLAYVSLSSMLIVNLPKIGVTDFKEAVQKINWSILFFYGGALTLSQEIASPSISTVLHRLMSEVSIHNYRLLLIFGLIILVVILRTLTSNTVMLIASVLPLLMNIAANLGMDSISVALIVISASTVAFIFPFQSLINQIFVSEGFYTPTELFRIGTRSTVVSICILFAFATLYIPFYLRAVV